MGDTPRPGVTIRNIGEFDQKFGIPGEHPMCRSDFVNKLANEVRRGSNPAGKPVEIHLSDGTVHQGILKQLSWSDEYGYGRQMTVDIMIQPKVDHVHVSIKAPKKEIKMERSTKNPEIIVIRNRRRRSAEVFARVEDHKDGTEQYLDADGKVVKVAQGAEMPLYNVFPDGVFENLITAGRIEYNR